jgi:hypothetical protein
MCVGRPMAVMGVTMEAAQLIRHGVHRGIGR